MSRPVPHYNDGPRAAQSIGPVCRESPGSSSGKRDCLWFASLPSRLEPIHAEFLDRKLLEDPRSRDHRAGLSGLPGQPGVRGPGGARCGPVDRSGAGRPAAQHQDDRQREFLVAGDPVRHGQPLDRQVRRGDPASSVLRRVRQRRLDRGPGESAGTRALRRGAMPMPSRTAVPMPISWPSGPSCAPGSSSPRWPRSWGREPGRTRPRRLVQTDARPVERRPPGTGQSAPAGPGSGLGGPPHPWLPAQFLRQDVRGARLYRRSPDVPARLRRDRETGPRGQAA